MKMKLLKSTLALVMMGSFISLQGQTAADDSYDVTLQEERTPVTDDDSWQNADPTIVGVATSNENFSTLVTALKAANLVPTLSGEGPFTVFAPTNAAFEKLPEGTVASLLNNTPALTKILTYHVVEGEFKAAAVVEAIQNNNNAFAVETVSGGTLTLSLMDGSVIITDGQGNTSKVTATDVNASNGVIHVIDTVVMPK